MLETPWMLFVIFPLAAYVIGSIPFGVLIARTKGVDLHKAGSGNVGATNVGRVLGRHWGYLCFVLDVAKGLVPVTIVGALLRGQAGFPTVVQQASWLATGAGVILGHVFSFWLRFRGGKGVATALGVVVGVFPYLTWPGLAALGVWIVVTLASRYVSLGSVIAAAAFLPLFALFNLPLEHLVGLWPMVAFAAVMVALILIRHRSNIRRLLAGTENKIGQKKPI